MPEALGHGFPIVPRTHLVAALLFRARAERELEEDLRFHLDMEVEANLARG